MKRLPRVVGAAVIVAGLLVAGFISYRSASMDRLFRQAMGYEPVGSEKATAAVRKLADYKGGRSSELLLEIALIDSPIVWPQARDEAIKALSRRGDSRVSAALADRLQPHQPIATRAALSRALVEMKCGEPCISSILHYLERLAHGEPNFEDRLEPPNSEFKKSLESEQSEVIHNLHKVLLKEHSETVRKLIEIYGLGTENPSTFALDLVSYLDLRDACPILLQTLERLRQSPIPGYNAPLAEIRKATEQLDCKSDSERLLR